MAGRGNDGFGNVCSARDTPLRLRRSCGGPIACRGRRDVPLATILDAAHRVYTGRLLEAELEREDRTLVYELEILTDTGMLIDLHYDARTGALIEIERED